MGSGTKSAEDSSRKPLGDPLGAHSEIGRKLKQYFDGLVSEDVPDRFANLLSQLESAEASRTKG